MAKPLKANMVIDYLDRVFEDRMKARRGDSWAPSSPNMNPSGLFLWGYLKEAISSHPLSTFRTPGRGSLGNSTTAFHHGRQCFLWNEEEVTKAGEDRR